MFSLRSLAILSLLPALAACSDSGTTSGIAYDALLAETNALNAEYPAGHPVTSANRVNAQSGTAIYDGTATLRVPTAQATSLLGTAEIGVSFNTRLIAGELSGFHGLVNGSDSARPFDGTLDMAGDFNTTRPRDIRTPIHGVLTGGGDRIEVTGIMDGDFLNGDNVFEPAEAIRANLAPGSTINMNGVNYAPGGGNSGLSVIAERD